MSFPHRDNISGLQIASMYLRDPQGGTHHYHIYPGDDHTLYPNGDPTEWKVLERVVILPPGSIPGTWGIAEMSVEDRAKNLQRYNFVEIVQFDVDG